ncbi:MAG: hypothetical protein ABS35_20345 [Kaistia sp. SCN 65-12]|nr:MAG: hypothetical protein ABS35_20345 [Kaistia sp. SCN 65-12]
MGPDLAEKPVDRNQIAAFVTEILNTGATLYAVGDDIYFFGDLAVADNTEAQVWAMVNDICDHYGSRDHLRREIVTHLVSPR